MPVSANCGKCNHKLSVRDEYAGRKIKCPKCQTPVQLPKLKTADGARPKQAVAGSSAGQAANRPRHNPLLDLLDDAGVEAAPRGSVCPNCGSDFPEGAIVCMQCGFHTELGKQMETAIMIDEDDLQEDAGMTDAQKRLAKAEREIDDTPIGEFGQDFGEGNESFLIAMVAIIFLVLFVAGGVTVVLSMDFITQYISSARISLIASIGMWLMGILWISTVAFRINPAHGLACILTGGVYCIPFGFMQGKSMFLPAGIMAASLLIGAASYYFVLNPGEDDSMIEMYRYAMQTVQVIGRC